MGSEQFNTQNFNQDFRDFQQNQQFAPQQQVPQQIPVSQLTREQIALEGFSRDDDQDGQIDALPAHLLPQQPQQPAFQQQSQQQFALQQPAFQQQPQQQFASRPQPAFQQQPAQQPSFRTPQPVGPSQVPQQQFSQAQLQQLFSQQQQG